MEKILILVVIIAAIAILAVGISGNYIRHAVAIQTNQTDNKHKIDLIDIINRFEITEFKRSPADECVYIRGRLNYVDLNITIQDIHIIWCNRTIVVLFAKVTVS